MGAENGMPFPRPSIQITGVTEWNAGQVRHRPDDLASEEPLEIRVGDRPLSVTMRTPGHDLELAAGFLFTEGLIQGREHLLSLESVSGDGSRSHGNVVRVEVVPELLPAIASVQRNFYAASSCGICGKASIDSVRLRTLTRPNPAFRLSALVLCDLPQRLREAQDIFARTGGLHAAALFDSAGKLLVVREDIGRHNAVDKVAGWALREGLIPLSAHVLLVSGRTGFEVAQKTIAAGIPVLASVSAPSSLAVQLARELGLTLAGFLRGERFVLYSGEERIQLDSGKTSAAQPPVRIPY
jgi:FdhD protein